MIASPLPAIAVAVAAAEPDLAARNDFGLGRNMEIAIMMNCFA